VQYPGAIYHVMSRGDRREDIFQSDDDRRLFLETLGQACEKTDWQVHAWRLMRNHFHLVVETPRANLVAGMKWLLGTYTSRYNRRHQLFGHLSRLELALTPLPSTLSQFHHRWPGRLHAPPRCPARHQLQLQPQWLLVPLARVILEPRRL